MHFHRKGEFYYTILKKHIYLIASSYNASLRNDEMLIETLKKLGYEGYVTVDMLLRNGNEDNRFLEVFFDGQHFKTRNATILEDKSKIIDIEKNFYKTHVELVENSILSMSEKSVLLSGESLLNAS